MLSQHLAQERKFNSGKRAESLQGCSCRPHNAKVPEILGCPLGKQGIVQSWWRGGWVQPLRLMFPAVNRDDTATLHQFRWVWGRLISSYLQVLQKDMRHYRHWEEQQISIHFLGFTEEIWGFSCGEGRRRPISSSSSSLCNAAAVLGLMCLFRQGSCLFLQTRS